MSPEASQRFLVTCALPYANGDLHLGHLLEAVMTDIFVRFQKLRSNQVLFVCADDTHGAAIELSANKNGLSPEQMVYQVRQNHIRDYAGFDIGFDLFYTTNSEENRRYAELIYNNFKKHELIVERETEQFFCTHDNRFLPDRFIIGTCPNCKAEDQYGDVCEACGTTYEPVDLVKPRCYICGKEPLIQKSRQLYVKLDSCSSFLKEYVENAGVLQEEIRNYVRNWISQGLQEWCISRDGPYFGFKIPGTENKYFYVWLDAPVGYLSTTEKWCKENGKRIEDYWAPESNTRIIHFIGKDIVYFHALFWPLMLKNSGFKLPSSIVVHGFLSILGQKMSKSRGTFILAKEYLQKVNHPQAPEYLRFFFGTKLMPNTADIDLSPDEFISRINTTLANNFGNLHHRTMVFCERYFDNKIPDQPWDQQIAEIVEEAASEISGHYEKCEIKQVVEKIHSLGSLGNKYYQDNKPWESVKTQPDKAAAVMVTCINLIKAIAVFLKPITPGLSARVERQLSMSFSWEDYRFSLQNKALGPTEKLVKPLEKEDIENLFPAGEKKVLPQKEGLIDIETFKTCDLRIGSVISAESIQKSKKLLKLQVDLGKERRQIISGIAESYTPEQLRGQPVVVLTNLKTATLMGHKSEGMILTAQNADGSVVLIQPQKMISSGAKIA
ncbi:MAG: methionine--tRNA ligase [Fibrobacter sp.]|jgi:methionyl-tRNA synthetase|nr:methionine--tRNA ligase [Fibrobacter sp.]